MTEKAENVKNLGVVSIIMPAYNDAEYIAESIQSIQSQTYPFWELIIVDDCSSDKTYEIVQGFCSDGRIRLLKNENNSGAALTRNYALREATGKWIAFLDADDVWLPEKLEKQLEFMVEHDYKFTYTKYEIIDENSERKGIMVSGPKKITKNTMYAYCWPGCLTVMYDAKHSGGGISIKDIRKNNDYAMWLKVCKLADCYLLDEVLAQYRKHSGSISNLSYTKLIKWHYLLFRVADEKGVVASLMLTIVNMICGAWKKLFYVKKAYLVE